MLYSGRRADPACFKKGKASEWTSVCFDDGTDMAKSEIKLLRLNMNGENIECCVPFTLGSVSNTSFMRLAQADERVMRITRFATTTIASKI